VALDTCGRSRLNFVGSNTARALCVPSAASPTSFRCTKPNLSPISARYPAADVCCVCWYLLSLHDLCQSTHTRLGLLYCAVGLRQRAPNQLTVCAPVCLLLYASSLIVRRSWKSVRDSMASAAYSGGNCMQVSHLRLFKI
jgi:hypothetical protein